MAMELQEVVEKRAKLIIENRELLDKVEKEGRITFNTEEQSAYEKRDKDIDKYTETISVLNKQEAREAMLETRSGTVAGRADAEGRSAGESSDQQQFSEDPELDAELRSFWGVRAKPEYCAAFRSFLRTGSQHAVHEIPETRDLQSAIGTAGGYLLAPQLFVNQLIKNVDDLVFVRPLAKVIPVMGGGGIGVPTLDADPTDPDWTGEIATVTKDTAMKFGKRDLMPHPLSKEVVVSNKLLRIAAINTEQLVRERLAYKFAVANEKGFLTGSGANQPLGIYTASADGIPTSRDVVAATSQALTGDGLIDVKFSIKSQYWARLRWNFHRDAVKAIRKLKDAVNGQYLWQPGLQGGVPDRLLDFGIDVSEFTPNTFTAGLYVGALGDWSTYWIVDSLNLQVQRLVELLARSHQTSFIGLMESDGAPTVAEAFSRVKLDG